MAAAAGKKMSFDEALPILENEAINKLIHNLELGLSCDELYDSAEYLHFYTVVYNVSQSEPEKLYCQYKRTFEDYISSKVLPSLRCNEDENLLRELLRRWSNHKIMTEWLSKFFRYLDRYFTARAGSPQLAQCSHLIFYDRACLEIVGQVGRAIASLVNREREGEEIDKATVKQVMDLFKEVGAEALGAKNIEQNLANELLSGMTAAKACMKVFDNVKDNVSRFPRLTNEDKILEVLADIEGRSCAAISSYIEKEALRERNGLRAILEEISDGVSKAYAKNIEEALLETTARFYAMKSFDWIATKSYEDYMLKVEACVEKEESRVPDYLMLINKRKLIEVVRHELVDVHAGKLQKMKLCSI